jgi:hypothetical protein
VNANLKEFIKNTAAIIMFIVFAGCSSMYFLDAPVSDPIMFVDDGQNSDLDRAEDGGLTGSAGECPT